MANKINQKEISWEPASHEDPEDPGVLKKVIVKRDDVDEKSKLMMVNLCKVPVEKTHKLHSHQTMEEIFYFTNGRGEVTIDDETIIVGSGDRIIVPAKSEHQIKNIGDVDLEYFGLGIALD